MIDAKELRVGNWVYPNDENHMGWQIKALDYSVAKFGINIIGESEDVDYEHLEPIPLTPEILEKVGFVLSINNKDMYLLRIGDTNFMLKDRKDGRFYSSPATIDCKYVHQIQNIHYILTGTELEINLQ